ncbi:MAG: hypothetical protein FWG39_03445, partial [Alphaproteobacteria bacterium]|nr:hypothetical protein [Alphaproteobacteria bacterium]
LVCAFAQTARADIDSFDESEEFIVEEILDDELFDEEGPVIEEPAEEIQEVEIIVPENAPVRPADTGTNHGRRTLGISSGATESRIGVMPVAGAVVRAPSGPKVTPVAQKVECTDKNNPYVIWADQDNCKATGCASFDLVLSGENTANPKCLRKCRVWGGTATRAWDGDDFGVCGGGEQINCNTGFVKTNERTSASGMQFWRCAPTGSKIGKCSKSGEMNICELYGGKAQQFCENGYWGLCTTNRFCEKGYEESEGVEAWTVINKKDAKMTSFNCMMK